MSNFTKLHLDFSSKITSNSCQVGNYKYDSSLYRKRSTSKYHLICFFLPMQETISFFRFPRKNGFLPSFRGFGLEKKWRFLTLQVYHLSFQALPEAASTGFPPLTWTIFGSLEFQSRHRFPKPKFRDFFYTYKTNGRIRCPWQKNATTNHGLLRNVTQMSGVYWL